MHDELYDKFDEYLAEAVTFDIVLIRSVYDLREDKLTWSDLGRLLDVSVLSQSRGFPSLGGDVDRTALLHNCKG